MMALWGLFFGLLTKSAASAFNQSTSVSHDFNKFVHAAQVNAELSYLGLIYFLVPMMIIMGFMPANSLSAMREDEAQRLS